MLESFFGRLAGKFIANKVGLEDKMDDTKKWYLSKGVWAGIVTGLLGIYAALAPALHLPVIPDYVFAVLGGLGVYSRVVADSKIG